MTTPARRPGGLIVELVAPDSTSLADPPELGERLALSMTEAQIFVRLAHRASLVPTGGRPGHQPARVSWTATAAQLREHQPDPRRHGRPQGQVTGPSAVMGDSDTATGSVGEGQAPALRRG
jgi:hypothetical protein